METRPFGQWPSPLSPDELAKSTRLRDVAWDADGRTLVWLEGRGPQGVLVCQEPGAAPRDLNTALSVRAQVGYGGGDFAVSRCHAYFAEHGGRLYRQPLAGGPAQPITPQFGHAASPAPAPTGRHLVYVHSYEDRDTLAVVDVAGRFWPQILAEGADFYMQPAWHPRGDRLAWNRVGSSADALGRHSPSTGPACAQPPGTAQPAHNRGARRRRGHRHCPALFFARWTLSGLCLGRARHTATSGAAISTAGPRAACTRTPATSPVPAWAQGMRAFSWAANSRTLYFVRNENAQRLAYALDFASGAITRVEALAAYTHIEQLAAAPRGKGLACIAAASAIPARIVAGTASQVAVRVRSASESLAPGRSLHARADFLGQRGRHASPRAVLSSGQPPLYWPRPTAADCHDPRRPHRPSRDRLRGHQSVFCHPGLCRPRR